MNPFKKIASVFRRTPNNLQTQTTNSIANDFLRRGNFKSKQDVQLDQKFNPEMTVNGWMYAALNIRSDAFGEFCEENIVSESEKQENPYHPYLKLIEESKEIPEYEFWKKAISNYDNYGSIYFFILRRIVKDKDGTIKHVGLPTKINILNSSKITALTHNGKIVGYKEQIDATHKREFAPEQIIRVINPHPRNQDEPYSIYEAAKDYQYTINKGTEFAQNALINNINTPGILSTSEVLNDEEYDNLISRINSHEPGKAIVTDGTGNLTYTSISQSLDQAALPTLTELSRQTIFAVTGTSKTILGIEESGVTRDTSKVQDKKFIKRSIAPVAKRVISAFNFDYRIRYPELYKQNGVKMVIKSIYDATETSEQFDVQKKLFDDITEIVYSGYTKESAEKFMYGDISFTDLELDAEDAQNIEDEQDDIDENLEEPEKTKEQEENDGSEKTLQNIHIENQESEMHNHTSSDDYYMKALKFHVNEQGELDEYGKSVENKIKQAKNNLLKEIRTIQLQAIRESNSKLSVNAFDYEDIRTEEQEDTIYKKIKNALRKYWFLILPLIGKERVVEDKNSIKILKEDNPELTEEEIQEKNEEIKKAEVNLLGTKKVKDYIEQVSEKAAKSHTNTIYKTILDAVNKAENKILRNLFAKEYVEQFKQGEDKWFKSKPTEKQVKSKLGNQNFVKDNQSLYDSVRKKIEEGFSREEIQRAIRKEYVDLSRTRANILVGNEMARSITSSQYVADYELLRKTNMLDKAYKRLVSSTGDPCPVCKALIDKGDIPFSDPFLELGDTIQVENDGKTTTFTCNYETIESGVVHCNCHCDYQLIIKG